MSHYVYRCYDAADRLLYIGCTSDMGSRMAVHYASGHNPASRVLIYRMVRHDVVEYANEAEAKQAERDAIYAEEPLANLHHQRVRETPAERERRISDYIEATRAEPDPWFEESLRRVSETLARFGSGAAS